MKFYTIVLIQGPTAQTPSKYSWYFNCNPEELQEKVRERFDSNQNFQGCKLKGITMISRLDGPNEYLQGTIFAKLDQFLICWI